MQQLELLLKMLMILFSTVSHLKWSPGSQRVMFSQTYAMEMTAPSYGAHSVSISKISLRQKNFQIT